MRTYDITVNIQVDAEHEDAARAFVAENVDCAYVIEEIAILDDLDDDAAG